MYRKPLNYRLLLQIVFVDFMTNTLASSIFQDNISKKYLQINFLLKIINVHACSHSKRICNDPYQCPKLFVAICISVKYRAENLTINFKDTLKTVILQENVNLLSICAINIIKPSP